MQRENTILERQTFEGNTVASVAIPAAAWLDIDPSFILQSYEDGCFERARYFERLGQKHATLKVTEI